MLPTDESPPLVIRALRKVLPLVTFLFCAALIWALHRWFPDAQWQFPHARRIARLLAVAGSGLGFGGILAFLRARTSLLPNHPERAATLVTTGIYRVSRNPMYAGLLLVLVAEVIYLGTTPGLLVLPIFIEVLQRWQIRPEEEALRAKFGADYAVYARRTRRWL